MKYGRYEILQELGKGSMGMVYRAHDPHIDRAVALKVLRPDRVTSETFVQRFLREAKAIGRLSHPGIVVVYDVGEDHNTVFISMEYLDGLPLNSIIETKKFAVEEIIRIGIEMAEALDYAHRRGIVHRDIKPSNIIVQSDGHAKITDFGIAHVEDPEATQQTQAGEILGTPAYMSPEQVLSQSVDGRSDLFSLGVILYELATGQRPFRGENLAVIFRNITSENPPEPGQINPEIPKKLSDTIMKCLSKTQEGRFADGHELAEALRRCEPALPRVVAAYPAPVPTPARAFPKAILLAAVILVAGVAGIAFFLMREPVPKPPVGTTDTRFSTGRDTKPSTTIPPSTTSGSAAKGTLSIETVPPGAGVLIDGEMKGSTPLKIDLPAGLHEVRLSLPDHGDWAARVRTSPGKAIHIPVELARLEEDAPR